MKAKNLLFVGPALCVVVVGFCSVHDYVSNFQDSNAQVVMNLPEVDTVKLIKNLSVYEGVEDYDYVSEFVTSSAVSSSLKPEPTESTPVVEISESVSKNSAFDSISVVNSKEIEYEANDLDFGTKGCIIRDRKYKVILTIPLFEGMERKALLNSVAVFSNPSGENTVTYYLNGQSLLEATDSVRDLYTVYSSVYDSVEVGVQKSVSYGSIDFVYYRITYQDGDKKKVFYYCIVDLGNHSLVIEIEGLQKFLKEKSIVGAFNLKIEPLDTQQDVANNPLD